MHPMDQELPDEDLRDVFKLLYQDEDWNEDDETTEESNGEIHPPMDQLIPESEADGVEALVDPEKEEIIENSTKIKKRVSEALDSLLEHSPKRARVYKAPSIPSSIFTSTTALPEFPSPSAYLPFSSLALLARLRSFRASTYSTLHPAVLSPVECALAGWTNVSRQGLHCGQCESQWSVEGLEDIHDQKVREEVARRMAKRLLTAHQDGCGWKIRISPRDLHGQLRNHLHPLLTSSLRPLAEQIQAECLAEGDIDWTSPMSSTQAQNLLDSLQRPSTRSLTINGNPSAISSCSTALAFFAWYPYQPNGSSTHIQPSTSQPTEIVQCRICERRVGLWSCKTSSSGPAKRPFDLVGEHLVWCPIRPAGDVMKWWDDAEVLKEKRGVEGKMSGWITLSWKMEVKPWRRKVATS